MKRPNKVEDLMDKKFVTFTAETTIPEVVAQLGLKRLFGAIVVDQSEKVVGICSEKAVLALYKDALAGKITLEELRQKKVIDMMYPEFQTIPKDLGLIEAAQLFLKVAYRRLPVIESERLVGQITRRDIVKGIEKYVQ